MRLWSLHPRLLDVRGLVALWREALLAKAVLAGETRGYRNHPQLERFRACEHPLLAINTYLAGVLEESRARGYAFDGSKVGAASSALRMPVSEGQLAYEWEHLLAKLAQRSPDVLIRVRDNETPTCHPIFQLHPGPVESWERIT